jgi:hypothetical protein
MAHGENGPPEASATVMVFIQSHPFCAAHTPACRNIIVLVIMGTVSCLVWLPRFGYIQGCRLISVHLTPVSYVPRLFVTI